MYELTPTVVCETAEDVLALARTVEARRRASRRRLMAFHMRLVSRKAKPVRRTSEPPDPSSGALGAGAEDWPTSKPVLPRIRDIQMAVCERYGIPLEILCGRSHRAEEVRPRHLALYLCRIMTVASMPIIARHFGYHDHTTVLHAFRVIKRKMATDEVLAAEIEHLTAKLRGQA